MPELLKIAKKFDMKIISIEDLIKYKLKEDSLIEAIEKSFDINNLDDLDDLDPDEIDELMEKIDNEPTPLFTHS